MTTGVGKQLIQIGQARGAMDEWHWLWAVDKDIELRFSQNGTAVGPLVAVGRNLKMQMMTDTFYSQSFGKLAENCANPIGKGRLVAVNGRI